MPYLRSGHVVSLESTTYPGTTEEELLPRVVPVFPKMREHAFELSSVELTAASVASYDCIVLTTDHDKFDYDMIQKNAKLIVDTRGKYRKVFPNVVKA